MSALEWLDEVRADLDEATPGPWEAGSFPDAPWDPAHSFVEIGEHEVRLDWLDGSALDARLIASAPDRLDKMERTLRAVLDLAEAVNAAAIIPTSTPIMNTVYRAALGDVVAAIKEGLK